MTIRLVIVGKVTPSLNRTLRQHFGVNKREAADWAARILYAARSQGVDTVASLAQGRRRLTIERHGKRQLDKDNLHGGAKVLVDELKRWRLIIDDRPEWCDLVIKQEPLLPKQEIHTVITLEDL